jgi:hypothetical protein
MVTRIELFECTDTTALLMVITREKSLLLLLCVNINLMFKWQVGCMEMTDLLQSTVSAAVHSICCSPQYLLQSTVCVAVHSICCSPQYLLQSTISVAVHNKCCSPQYLLQSTINVAVTIYVAVHNKCCNPQYLLQSTISVAVHNKPPNSPQSTSTHFEPPVSRPLAVRLSRSPLFAQTAAFKLPASNSSAVSTFLLCTSVFIELHKQKSTAVGLETRTAVSR